MSMLMIGKPRQLSAITAAMSCGAFTISYQVIRIIFLKILAVSIVLLSFVPGYICIYLTDAVHLQMGQRIGFPYASWSM